MTLTDIHFGKKGSDTLSYCKSVPYTMLNMLALLIQALLSKSCFPGKSNLD